LSFQRISSSGHALEPGGGGCRPRTVTPIPTTLDCATGHLAAQKDPLPSEPTTAATPADARCCQTPIDAR
jgi:hypothetical protein